MSWSTLASWVLESAEEARTNACGPPANVHQETSSPTRPLGACELVTLTVRVSDSSLQLQP
jgi:hypothetical protein